MSIHKDLADILHYCQHLTDNNHADRDTPISWTYNNFNLWILTHLSNPVVPGGGGGGFRGGGSGVVLSLMA